MKCPCLTFAALVLTLALPSRSHAQEVTSRSGEGAADGTRRPGFLIAGVSVLGSTYLATTALATANLEDYTNVEAGFIPIAGPFVTAARIEPKDGHWFTATPVMRVFYVAAGIGQLAGVTLTAIGLALPAKGKSEAARVTVSPVAAAGGGGFVAHGAF